MQPLSDYQADFRATMLDPRANVPAGDLRRIHRNNCFHGLSESLAALYPVVGRLVGRHFFLAMARAFIEENPPTSPVLLDYGADFADFVVGFPHAAALTYLPDVARLEWLWHQVYHGPDASPLPVERLTDIRPAELPDLRLTLHPARRFLASAYPVDEIWRVNQEDFSGDRRLALTPVDCRLLIIRPRLEVKILALDPATQAFAEALAAGATLCAAHRRSTMEQGAFEVGAALRTLAAAECFVGLSATA